MTEKPSPVHAAYGMLLIYTDVETQRYQQLKESQVLHLLLLQVDELNNDTDTHCNRQDRQDEVACVFIHSHHHMRTVVFDRVHSY